MLSRWPEEIEADMSQTYPGLNFRWLYRTKQWRRLLILIDQLPSHSRLTEAQANDRELVREQWLSRDKADRGKQWSPKISEYDAHLRSQALIYDRLGELIQAVFSTIQVPKGKSKPKYKGSRFPPPETILEEIKEEEARETGSWMIASWMPHAADGWGDGSMN